MKQGCATVYVIIAITIALVFLVKIIAGNDKKPSYFEEVGTQEIVNPTPDTVKQTKQAEPEKTTKPDNSVQPTRTISKFGTSIEIKNVSYAGGAYNCKYRLSNLTGAPAKYSVNYIIEERGPEGRFEKLELLGSRDLGSIASGTGIDYDFRVPDFSRKSGYLYRIKVEAYIPGKNRGEPVEYQTSPI